MQSRTPAAPNAAMTHKPTQPGKAYERVAGEQGRMVPPRTWRSAASQLGARAAASGDCRRRNQANRAWQHHGMLSLPVPPSASPPGKHASHLTTHATPARQSRIHPIADAHHTCPAEASRRRPMRYARASMSSAMTSRLPLPVAPPGVASLPPLPRLWLQLRARSALARAARYLAGTIPAWAGKRARVRVRVQVRVGRLAGAMQVGKRGWGHVHRRVGPLGLRSG
jgi:hypothetical protein